MSADRGTDGYRQHAVILALVLISLVCPSAHGRNAAELLTASAQSCTDSSGGAVFCAPWPLESIISTAQRNDSIVPVTITSSRDCVESTTLRLCTNNGSCDALFCTNTTTVESVLSGDGEWRSAPLTNSTEEVTLDIDLGRAYLLFSITLVFRPTSIPERFQLSRSNSSTDMNSTVIATLGVENVSTNGSVTIDLISVEDYSERLGDQDGVMRLVQDIEASMISVTLLEAGNESFVNDTSTNDVSPFYALTQVIVSGLCQCNGHASSCVAGQCQCEHMTVDIDCSACNATGGNQTEDMTTGGDNTTTNTFVGASRTSGLGICGASVSSQDDDDDLTTEEIIIIACCAGGGLLILLAILIACCCVRRRRRYGGGVAFNQEDIVVIDATGLHQVTIKNRGFHDDETASPAKNGKLLDSNGQ
eukprot:scpid69058/ scgid10157/ 